MTQPAQSHLFNCVLWHGIDNSNVRHFTPRHFTPDITRVNQTFPRLIISKRLVIMTLKYFYQNPINRLLVLTGEKVSNS